MTLMNQVKNDVNNMVNNESFEYCEIIYDGEDSIEDNVWLYDFNIYDDDEDRIIALEEKLNNMKYVKATLYCNLDDGDYTIETVIDIVG